MKPCLPSSRSSATKIPCRSPSSPRSLSTWAWATARTTPKALEVAVKELAAIAGQQPLVTKARKSIANFKLREGMNVGAKVTLRGSRMEEFMDKLVNIALPRVRDFRGVSDKAFDGRGNYALGIREQLLFPRNRVRQGGKDPRHGNDLRNDRPDRRGVQGTASSAGNAFRAVRIGRSKKHG